MYVYTYAYIHTYVHVRMYFINVRTYVSSAGYLFLGLLPAVAFLFHCIVECVTLV